MHVCIFIGEVIAANQRSRDANYDNIISIIYSHDARVLSHAYAIF